MKKFKSTKKSTYFYLNLYKTDIVYQYEVESIEEIHENAKEYTDTDEMNDDIYTMNFRNMWAAWGAEINAGYIFIC